MKFLDLITKYSSPFLGSFIEANMHIIEGTSNFLENEENTVGSSNITPKVEVMLSAFKLVSLDPYGLFTNSLRVVIMLQDVYPTPGVACGISLASLNERPQPSLALFYKRLRETYTPETPMESNGPWYVREDKGPTSLSTYIKGGDIRGWCSQGVLMLNAALSTRVGSTESHLEYWSIFTSAMVKWLSGEFPFLVFVLMGNKAQSFSSKIDSSRHVILTTSHCSKNAYHYGFDKCDIFNEINHHLKLHKRDPVRWEKYEYIYKCT